MSWGQNYFVSTDWQEILPPKLTKNRCLYKNPCDSWHVTPCWELCYLLISLPSFHLQRYKKNPKYASKIMFIFLIFNSFYERQMRSDNWTLSCYRFVIIWVRQTYLSSYYFSDLISRKINFVVCNSTLPPQCRYRSDNQRIAWGGIRGGIRVELHVIPPIIPP